MKFAFLIIFLLLLLPILHRQAVQREEPDLVVVKFSWAKDVQRSSMIRGAQDPRGSISTPITDDRDLSSRRADMQVMEKKAATSTQTGSPSYQLRLEVKNDGSNEIRGFAWEFKPTAGPDDYEPKQYLCALRVKAKEKRILELWTPYAPVKVITVDARKDALKDGIVVINKVDYADGSVWTKRGWNIQLPADSLKKLTDGTCSVF
jgi:nitrogen fixation protein